MDTGDVGPKTEARPDVIVDPEGWDDIKKKYQEREEEALKRVMQKKKAESVGELLKAAGESITKRSNRTAEQHKAVKDRQILVDPANAELKKMRKELFEEIKATTQKIFKELPQQAASALQRKSAPLKGRVTQGIPPPSEESED